MSSPAMMTRLLTSCRACPLMRSGYDWGPLALKRYLGLCRQLHTLGPGHPMLPARPG